ncbi:hypothetical protein ACFUTV_39800 [Streptomyces sp. NPDC057298]|uniref:hypothetical protein n=1 Tax=Streptomyces sp. NPDC057298 TaxID=3346091 RepID=UPI00363F9F3A
MQTRPALARFAVVTALAAVGTGTVSVPASASDAAYSQDKKYCMTVLAPLTEGAEVSEVLSHGCYSTKTAHDRAVAADRLAAVTLTVWSEHANWGGQYQTVLGSESCDAAGYGLHPNAWWRDNLSSFYNGYDCNNSYLSGPRGNGTFGASARWVGANLDNAVTYMKIWR